MGNYSFNQYIAKKDTLDEAWPQWMGNIGQKLGFGNKTAARDTSDLMPRYSPGTQPNKTATSMPGMSARAANYFDRLQNPRVNFTGNELRQVLNSSRNYLNAIRGIPGGIKQLTQAHPDFVPYLHGIKDSLESQVGPAWKEMNKWVGWAENMLSQLPKNEWGQEDNELLTEAIKVNYRNFENMAMAMRNLKNSLNSWYKNTIEKISSSAISDDMKMKASEFANSVKLFLQEKIMPRAKALTDHLSWLLKKVQELMTLNNRPYSGLPS